METPPPYPPSAVCGISHLGDDLLQNIIGKLPAQSFASAACVNRSWNAVCARVLSRPVIASALSLNSSLPEAMKEVVGKVLSGPIRPHFAILCICPAFDLDEAHRLITHKLGSKTPLITCDAGGIVGRDALSDQFSEVMFPYYDDEEVVDPADYKGISLTVGYVPGLKVDVIPLMYSEEGHISDKFVMDIRDYSASVSGYTSPEAIFMFGDSEADMKPVIEKLDYALPEQTIIAGNETCRFRCSRMNNPSSSSLPQSDQAQTYGAVGLVFASNKNAPNGAWKIDFHFAVGAGVAAVGPNYRVVSAKSRNREYTTWLTAKREGENEPLDGEQILDDLLNVNLEAVDPIFNYDLYIGVTKRRKYSFGGEKVKALTFLSYHPVQQGDEQYLYVRGLDIKTGDSFRFYLSNPGFALGQCDTVSDNIRRIRHKEMIGGFLFSCCGRGSTFFARPNVDSLPILNNFPSIPLAGMFCGTEIGRGPPIAAHSGPEQDKDLTRTCLHVYSSVYVLMSCSQPSCRP
ncbi:F-box/LRR-repeat protein At5g63520 isoform X1 [Silene latifolia]|uniref:F-box/LRR-repeat protein At5g63520 isoform X1 n=1 Tax=Silene latifolia TaxID=37657 RepID=UPI003D76A594